MALRSFFWGGCWDGWLLAYLFRAFLLLSLLLNSELLNPDLLLPLLLNSELLKPDLLLSLLLNPQLLKPDLLPPLLLDPNLLKPLLLGKSSCLGLLGAEGFGDEGHNPWLEDVQDLGHQGRLGGGRRR